MRKIIKVGFPIVCIVLIGGTFYLLNKFQKEINESQKASANISNSSENKLNRNELSENELNNNVLSNNALNENEVVNESKNEIANNELNDANNNISAEAQNDTNTMFATPVESENQSTESENEKSALKIAEDYYGDYDDVYYTNEGKEDDKYIVAVRDKESTNAKIYYSIDVEQKSVEIYY